MKTVTNPRARFIALLLVTGTLGLLLLMHVTSARQSRCAGETSEIGVIKLI